MEIVDKLLNHSRLALSKAITAVENEYDDAVPERSCRPRP